MTDTPDTGWTLAQFDVPIEEGKKRFHDFDLPLPLMHAISDLGFNYCTPIQHESFAHSLLGADLIGKAQTGTGKTAAFLITVITDLINRPLPEDQKPYNGEPRALILAPTRELALQIGKDAQQLLKYTDMKVVTLVGGMDYEKQQRALNNSIVDIVVATPGRLIDFARKRDVYLDGVEALVIDEADRMLDMGFIPDVKSIIRMTPQKENRQTMLFSATFTQDILNLSSQWTLAPEYVEIEAESLTTDSIDQKVFLCTSDEKNKLLYNLIQQNHLTRLMVFANRRIETQKLCQWLNKKGIKAEMLSGDVPQKKRLHTLEAFKRGDIKVLVATDVAGRGIHVDDVSHVVNYSLPENPEDYVHRIGRTGRAGKTGTSISFACEEDAFALPSIEKAINQKFDCQYPPAELLNNIP